MFTGCMYPQTHTNTYVYLYKGDVYFTHVYTHTHMQKPVRHTHECLPNSDEVDYHPRGIVQDSANVGIQQNTYII